MFLVHWNRDFGFISCYLGAFAYLLCGKSVVVTVYKARMDSGYDAKNYFTGYKGPDIL